MNSMEANKTHYLGIEIQDLLEKLSEADTVRILQVYRTLGCHARTGLSANELLNQVVDKSLSLERQWPRNLIAISFFIETGKSIISNEEQKRSKLIVTPTIDEVLIADDSSLKQASATSSLSHPSAEIDTVSDQSDKLISTWMMSIRKLFTDDPEADCFISQKLDEQKKFKILDICKFTDQVYRNVEKRIKDKVRKRYPNGLPWWELDS